jgi:nicotinamidase/pyrazinamidase
MLKVHLICIDDQIDFTDPNGALFVKGGEQNVGRIAKMVKRLTPKLSDITLTMDSHHILDISHPTWWVNESGNNPAPFTGVVAEGDQMWFFDYMKNAKTERASTNKLGFKERTLAYIKTLSANGRYPHTIWPEHCLIGDKGHNINPVIAEAVHEWERKRFGVSDVVTKGSNMWTEHFSAVKAEVPDPKDPSTQINRPLITALEEADMVLWVGEALSHCLANTFRDVVANFSNPEFVKKMVLLTDASSSVPGFEKFGDDFIREMLAKGMRTDTTDNILS